ncbi:hypothetical protein CEK28_14990 [Xenophilus sp. AP218F]|nr:DUF3592 domain-containing protein [Chromobacterium sp. ASV5]OWY37951.1 hypothetical protein CEK28_14990 [Xenophilus sp. AP218F]
MNQIIAGLALVAIGVAASLYLWQQARLAEAAGDWPIAHGVIEASLLDSRPRRGGGDSSGQLEYRALIRYRYSVGGATHHSQIRRFPDPGYGASAELAREVVNRYPPGSAAQVRYNPDNPAQACLEPGSHWSLWAGRAIALLFAVAGTALLLRR